MPNPIVTNYVDAAIAQLRRQNLMCTPGKLPDAMRDDSIAPSEGWIGWRPIPSTVTDEDLNSLEQETGLAFPPLYRDLLKYQHFVELTERGVGFERHLPNKWMHTLRTAYFSSWPRERILDVGLLPFGNERFVDAGPVCFDTRQRAADGDCPVVFWDHEWVGTKKEIQLMFSSSAKMFECLLLVASTDLNFVYYDSSKDGPAQLAEKRELLAKFLAIDPTGAGGAAKEYWAI